MNIHAVITEPCGTRRSRRQERNFIFLFTLLASAKGRSCIASSLPIAALNTIRASHIACRPPSPPATPWGLSFHLHDAFSQARIAPCGPGPGLFPVPFPFPRSHQLCRPRGSYKMASTTGLPERPPATAEAQGTNSRETEPLLGRPGDASQRQGASIWMNLVLGMPSPAPIPVPARAHRPFQEPPPLPSWARSCCCCSSGAASFSSRSSCSRPTRSSSPSPSSP